MTSRLCMMVGISPLAVASLWAAGNAQEPECYSVWGNSSYVLYGFNHVVTVKNDCGKTLQCEVWTSVDPEPKISMTVESGASQSVTTRRGSPASAFKAYGQCE